MKSLLFPLLLVMFLDAAAQEDKEGAKTFFLSVVKTYFDRDCDKFLSCLSDSMSIVSPYGEGLLSSEEIHESRKPCEKFEEFTRGLPSFDFYKEHYKIVVLTKEEFTPAGNKKIEKLINARETGNLYIYEILREFNRYYTPDDHLVFGNAHKNDPDKNLGDGLFWMIVRKTKDGWKIFGTQN